jgi:glucose-6-phosphate isomerase
VINVGIGGSDLGPVMAYEALRHYSKPDMTFRFVSNVDSTDLVEATRDLAAGGDAVHHLPHRVMDGNRPTNVLLAEALTPRA